MRLALLTFITLCCFALNSIFSRFGLKTQDTDAFSFAAVRSLSATVFLILLLYLNKKKFSLLKSHYADAACLIAYLLCFSVALVSLNTGVGALIAFSSVQITMIGIGIYKGEKFSLKKIIGATLAISGLVYLLWPGIETPNLFYASLMSIAGMSWGIYSILGKKSTEPVLETANHFVKATIVCGIALIFARNHLQISTRGMIYAILSGVLGSGIGYSVWYKVLPKLTRLNASLVQLFVPVIAALGGVIFLNEMMTLRLALAFILTLSGVTIAII